MHKHSVKKMSLVLFALMSLVIFTAAVIETNPRIFLIGDSTMADKPLIDNPEHGWGQMLPIFFKDNVRIFNHAKNGRSTKSFITEGRWKAVMDQLEAGDYVFIQFGHNDAKKEDTSRYAAPHTDYKSNLLKFVRETRSKNANPVLLTPITRREFDSTGRFVGTHGDYPAVVKEVSREEHVPMIDMFEKSSQLVKTLGDKQSKKLYLNGVHQEFRSWNRKRDNTHFTRTGAIRMAALAVEGIKELRLPLDQSLLPGPLHELAGTGKVVGLDYYYNNEWRFRKDSVLERFHYVWEDTTNSGFSQLGRIIDLLGADLDTLQTAPSDSMLNFFSVYVIVDPDTPLETKHPHYMSDDAIKVIVPWVEHGGVLVLMENDKGNAEFEHFNKLAERFGMHFNEESYHKVIGKAYETARNNNLPDHPIFKNVKQIFTKEVSTLRLAPPAEPILKEDSLVLMASARVGKGMVFAVCDPWLYNEYMDTRRLPADYENSKAGRNLFHWLLEHAAPVANKVH